MKIGSCLLLLASSDDPLAQSSIELIARSGYDYAEVALARLLDLTDRQLGDYCARFDAAGLRTEVFNNANPRGMALVGPLAEPRTLAVYRAHALALAQRMGASLITMSGPSRRTVPQNFDWEGRGFDQYVAYLQRFADEAAAIGVGLALEPINSEEQSFLSTVAGARRVVEACEKRNIGLMVDTYHFLKQEDDAAQLEQAYPHLVHIHYAAQTQRTYPLENDRDACEAMLGKLLRAGYQGRISIEAYADNPADDLPAACQLLRSISQSRKF